MELSDITRVCVLGAGTMGSSIALSFASHGFNVDMFDISQDRVKKGFDSVEASMGILLENGLLKKEELRDIPKRIKGCISLEQASASRFVIECAPEKLDLKQSIFQELEKYFPEDAVFATNTSGLSPSAIASKLVHKDRFTASNFWNPAHLLPLVEIMPGEATSPETLRIVKELMKKIGKKPVVLKKETPGFIGNRLQFALLREALHIVDSDIASKEDVDTAVKYGIGRRLGDTGPLETADLGGTHVYAAICEALFRSLSNSETVSTILTDAVKNGDLGYTTGRGIYDWTDEGLSEIQHKRQQTLIEWLRRDREEQ